MQHLQGPGSEPDARSGFTFTQRLQEGAASVAPPSAMSGTRVSVAVQDEGARGAA